MAISIGVVDRRSGPPFMWRLPRVTGGPTRWSSALPADDPESLTSHIASDLMVMQQGFAEAAPQSLDIRLLAIHSAFQTETSD